MRRRTFLAASLTSGALASGAAAWWKPGAQSADTALVNAAPAIHTAAALAFGTTISIHVAHRDADVAQRAMHAALSAATEIDALMSLHSDSSQLVELNRRGALADAHPHVLAVLREALRLAALTDGAFDVTVQPLWRIYAEAARHGGLPTPAQRAEAQALVGWRDLTIAGNDVRLGKPGMAVTLNGIAQGYAVDVALQTARAHGVTDALFDIGEFAALGKKPDHQSWVLGVQDPRRRDMMSATLLLDGRSIATSGDYETVFTPDYVHHHIFDPSVGDSPPELASVTVAAPSGMLADGLSTAFLAMGSRRAMQLAAQLPGVDAMFIDKSGIRWKTAGFREAAI